MYICSVFKNYFLKEKIVFVKNLSNFGLLRHKVGPGRHDPDPTGASTLGGIRGGLTIFATYLHVFPAAF